MTTTHNLPPDLAAELIARSESIGLSAEEILENRELPHGVIPARPMSSDEFRQAFLAWADSFPQVPFVQDDRESLYQDR